MNPTPPGSNPIPGEIMCLVAKPELYRQRKPALCHSGILFDELRVDLVALRLTRRVGHQVCLLGTQIACSVDKCRVEVSIRSVPCESREPQTECDPPSAHYEALVRLVGLVTSLKVKVILGVLPSSFLHVSVAPEMANSLIALQIM